MNHVDPLPRVMHEAGAAVLLVDLRTTQVVYVNKEAANLGGDEPLPVGVVEWGLSAGLTDLAGRDAADGEGALARLVRGEPVAGQRIERRGRTPDALWLTAFPLRGGGLEDRALVVLMPLSSAVGEPGSDPRSASEISADADWALDPVALELVSGRAVIATDLSFTISDPTIEDDPLIWVNPAFTRTTGYTAADACGRNCRFLQGPATDRAEVARIRAALDAAEPVTSTLLNYRKDGTAFWNQVSISPVFDADGALANFVGVQVDVSQRVEAEHQRERARARVDFLAAVSAAVSTFDAQEAFARLSDLLIAWPADGVLVVSVEEGEVKAVCAAGTVPRDVLGRRRRLPRPGPGPGDPVAALLRGDGPDDVVLDVVLDIEALRRASGTASAWVARLLPPVSQARALTVSGRSGVHGVLFLLGAHLVDPAADADDLAVLREAAARCGLAVENARLFAREHALAQTLQRSMLPPQAHLPDFDIWTHYAPGPAQAQIGGDWYDVLTRPDGSHAIVVGDVVGHDVEAAAVMGQLRSVSRAYAFDHRDPATILDRVDQLAFGMEMSRLASAVFLSLTPIRDRWRLTWSNAGHLPPIVRRGSQVRSLTASSGSLVGLLAGGRVSEEIVLEPGDWVVLYTDGLIERRARPMADGLRALEALVSRSQATTAEDLGQDILAGLGQDAEDDLAVIVLRVPELSRPAAAEGEGVLLGERVLDRTAHAPRQARALAAEWLRVVRRRADPSVLLVVSELVTNAYRHARGEIFLALSMLDGQVLVEVRDENPKPPEPGLSRPDGGGQGLHIVARLGQWGWRPTDRGKVVWARLPDVEDDRRGTVPTQR